MPDSPPSRVLAAFGATDAPTKLSGGRGQAWAAGSVILKPLDLLPGELDWLASVRPAAAADAALELSLPLRSRSGRLIEDGWTAFPRLPGEPNPHRWHDLAAIARRFASDFGSLGRPAFIDVRTHAWARADRLAWDEAEAVKDTTDDHIDDTSGAPHLAALTRAKRPIADPSGIVHGDLTGNVLFDAGRASAVIDLTIYWRPVEYSVAIIAVDSVCFGGAPLTLLESISPAHNFPQQLIRALIFREATDWFNRLPRGHFAVYDGAVERALALAAR